MIILRCKSGWQKLYNLSPFDQILDKIHKGRSISATPRFCFNSNLSPLSDRLPWQVTRKGKVMLACMNFVGIYCGDIFQLRVENPVENRNYSSGSRERSLGELPRKQQCLPFPDKSLKIALCLWCQQRDCSCPYFTSMNTPGSFSKWKCLPCKHPLDSLVVRQPKPGCCHCVRSFIVKSKKFPVLFRSDI